jgi:hypothetical protein
MHLLMFRTGPPLRDLLLGLRYQSSRIAPKLLSDTLARKTRMLTSEKHAFI